MLITICGVPVAKARLLSPAATSVSCKLSSESRWIDFSSVVRRKEEKKRPLLAGVEGCKYGTGYAHLITNACTIVKANVNVEIAIETRAQKSGNYVATLSKITHCDFVDKRNRMDFVLSVASVIVLWSSIHAGMYIVCVRYDLFYYFVT